jgi:Fic family protein
MIFQTPVLDSDSLAVLSKIDTLKRRVGSVLQQPQRWDGLLRRTMQAKALRGSNTIEGYNVTVDDALAAVEGEEPLDADSTTWAEIVGYRQAMTYVIQLALDPSSRVSCDIVKSLHFMMLQHDLTKSPGQWRPGQIFVKREETGETVYEGPDAGMVPDLMSELCRELNGSSADHLIVRGAMAHLNLVMIHPFRDGNGRTARCLQTLVLAHGGHISPVFISIEEYYKVLAEVGAGSWQPERDAAPWIRFCLKAHFRQVTTVLNRMERVERIWNALELEIKRSGLPERSIMALADAAMGLRVRNPTYRKAADITDGVAGRDLRLLVENGFLEPRGEKRGRYYVAAAPIIKIRADNETRNRMIDDPFGQLSLDLPGIA